MLNDVSNIQGFASITNVRGTARYLFDLSFSFSLKYSDKMKIEVADFSPCSEFSIRISGGSDVNVRDFANGADFRKALTEKQSQLLQYLASI